jgi:hypothetical protein
MRYREPIHARPPARGGGPDQAPARRRKSFPASTVAGAAQVAAVERYLPRCAGEETSAALATDGLRSGDSRQPGLDSTVIDGTMPMFL